LRDEQVNSAPGAGWIIAIETHLNLLAISGWNPHTDPHEQFHLFPWRDGDRDDALELPIHLPFNSCTRTAREELIQH
jgi:hypothetical protein